MTNKFAYFFSGILFAVLTMAAPAQDLPKLHEKVEVRYIEAPVRVFQKGKPVDGLNTDDFTLYVDGIETPVTAVSIERKTLDWGEGAESGIEPRLFVLIFNIADYRMNLNPPLDTFFDSVLHPNDQVMMISNSFFIPERVIKQPGSEKKEFRAIIDLEQKWLKQRIVFLENRLVLELNDLRARLIDGDKEYFTQTLLPRFVDSYKRYAAEHRQHFLNIEAGQYLKLAEYLREQHLDKWVITFIQRGSFPIIKKNGNLYRTIQMFQREFQSGDTEMVSMILHDIMQDLEFNILTGSMDDKSNLAKSFSSTGATFHTVLLKPLTPDRMLEDFEWRPVPTDAETVMVEASRLTGGSVIYDNRFPVFFEKIKEKQDILYRLVYREPENKSDKPKNIRVKVSNPDYELVYDNQQRQEYLRRIADQVLREKKRIRFGDILLKDRLVIVPILDAKKPENNGEIRVDLRLRIISNAGRTLFDRHREFTLSRSGESLSIQLPELKKGEYDIVLEGTDLNSGAGDLVIHSIRI